MARLLISLFGSVKVNPAGQAPVRFPADKVQALLVYLAVEADRPHRRESLAGLLWPDRPEETARHSLSQALLRLRRVIRAEAGSPPLLLVTRQTLQVNPAGDYWLDVADFQACLRGVKEGPGLEAGATAMSPAQRFISTLHRAVELYRGDFLANFFLADNTAFEEWALSKREQLRQQALIGLDWLAGYYEQQAGYEPACHYARRLVELDAYREESHRRLMRLLYLSGQRNAALAQYEACRQLLLAELGVKPAAETVLLYEQIRAGELGPEPGRSPGPLAAQATGPARVAWPDLYLARRLESLPEARLFGTGDLLGRLLPVLLQPDPPWLVALHGMGGSGKSALARALVRASLPSGRFDDIIWLNAGREEFLPEGRPQPAGRPVVGINSLVDELLRQLRPDLDPALSPRERLALLTFWLKSRRYLVVLDNLAVTLDHASLLPLLEQLANPARFLLTSRRGLWVYAAGLYSASLPALEPAEAAGLLAYELERRGRPGLAPAVAAALDQVQEVTGGNPLALKLVADQMGLLPLARLLDNLAQGRGQAVEAFYRYLYRPAWASLSAAGRRALLALLLAPDGGFENLARASGLTGAELEPALQQLVTLSLLDVSGDLAQPRYRLQPLTGTFLRRFILGPAGLDGPAKVEYPSAPAGPATVQS